MTNNIPQDDPLVSIRCLVYNHEPFLRQCLNGFVMQETTFPFEAIVHDDASTDGSAAIIREYAEKYPHIIKPIYEAENQWGKGTINKNIKAAMHPNSKYIASCEGDDFWTDPHKLQLQVDFLESHSDYVMCSHDFSVYDNKEGVILYDGQVRYKDLSFDEVYNGQEYKSFDLDDSFDFRFTATLTNFYRRDEYISDELRRQIPYIFDSILFYFILKKGRCALFKRNMATYRVHSGGVYSGGNTEVVNNQSLDCLYPLYRIEQEKRWLPKINIHFVDLFCYLAKRGKLKKLIKITLRHAKEMPIGSFLAGFGMIVHRLFTKLF